MILIHKETGEIWELTLLSSEVIYISSLQYSYLITSKPSGVCEKFEVLGWL